MFTPEQIREIEDLIKVKTAESFAKRIGDTPTEALQLVNKKYVDTNILAGSINGNGVIVSMPDGWTVSHPSAGNFQINHDLNTSNVLIIATASESIDTDFTGPITSVLSPNTFRVTIGNLAATAGSDQSFHFFIKKFT